MNPLSVLIELDHRISENIVNCHSAWGDMFFLAVTAAGDPWFIMFVAAVASITYAFHKQYNRILLLLFVLSGSFSFMTIIKNLVQRSRPGIETIIEAAGYSFPSGHSTVSMAFYGVLAYILAQNMRPTKKKWIYITAGILILGIGCSRIYWNVHYLSDVLAGFSLGAIWLWIAIRWIAPPLKLR